MAHLQANRLFFTTSPRTPSKMIPEIKLLTTAFENKVWNPVLQREFYELLRSDSSFVGGKIQQDTAFSARDRITRAPKSLGFVDLKPVIKLTDAGKAFIDEETSDEALLRQLLKFQLPSPYHKEPIRLKGNFSVKPYLEILRLIDDFGTLSFDEIMLFGIQLTNYQNYDTIKKQIENFRIGKAKNKGQYKKYLNSVTETEIRRIYAIEFNTSSFKTRESNDLTYKNFMRTQKNNLRDYADACFRYLRATGIVSISQKMSSLSIPKERMDEVRFILDTIDRNPVYVNEENNYKSYLFDATQPLLLTDNRNNLVESIMKLGTYTLNDLSGVSLIELKKIKFNVVRKNKEKILHSAISSVKKKSYDSYTEIIDTYHQILNKEYYDSPLMLEYNTWKAMAFLTDGSVNANLKFDDKGEPMSTASGNMADIVCDYDSFDLAVEVTLTSGQRQYEAEGETVSRHLGKMKKNSLKDTYCLFIAPTLNEATISQFYTLHKVNISYYGGTSIIVPIELDVFMKMVENSFTENPRSEDLKRLFEDSKKIADESVDEKEWHEKITKKALNWPN